MVLTLHVTLLVLLVFLIGCLIGTLLKRLLRGDQGVASTIARENFNHTLRADTTSVSTPVNEALPRQHTPHEPDKSDASGPSGTQQVVSAETGPSAEAAVSPSDDATGSDADGADMASSSDQTDDKQPATLSAEPDDLKKIKGVGPVLEKKLHALGITTYAQICNWTSDDIERVDATLNFKGRIEREGWIEQAKLLKNG